MNQKQLHTSLMLLGFKPSKLPLGDLNYGWAKDNYMVVISVSPASTTIELTPK